jgi:hypothetical protein
MIHIFSETLSVPVFRWKENGAVEFSALESVKYLKYFSRRNFNGSSLREYFEAWHEVKDQAFSVHFSS